MTAASMRLAAWADARTRRGRSLVKGSDATAIDAVDVTGRWRLGRPANTLSDLDRLLQRIRSCTFCRDTPRYLPPLAMVPRPVIQFAPQARICIVGQAPGIRVHRSGIPFTDPSGKRLGHWLGIDEQTLHNAGTIAIVPMGMCFPGNDAKGGDLPPRRECAELWHTQVMNELRQIELLLLVGGYAQKWHLGRKLTAGGVTGTVQRWREIYDPSSGRRILPLPHPSWRNTGWVRRNPWFERDLIPTLRADMAALLLGRVAV